MTRNKLVALLISILLSPLCYADTTVSYQAGPSGGLTLGPSGKKAGDIISLVSDNDIAAYCNFDKTIILTRTSILCVYNGVSPTG